MRTANLLSEKKDTSPQTCSGNFFGTHTVVQPKLTVNSPGDAHEQEADAMADKVMRMPDTKVQRKCAACEKEEEEKHAQRKPLSDGITPVHRKSGDGGGAVHSSVEQSIQSRKGMGQSLPGETRNFMEQRIGADFSNVRVHTDTDAVQLSRDLNAKAFTTGSDIYFNNNEYAPHSASGRQLLAHELTHVVQQGASGHAVQRNATGGASMGAVERSTGASGHAVQRSCNDGACDSCDGGIRDFWITFYFRRRATRATMRWIRQQINGARTILNNCCLRLKCEFNWTLLSGGGDFTFLDDHGDGTWNYLEEAQALGEGNTFNGSRGIPILVVDNVADSGGGVTVDNRFDATYTGRTYAVIAANQRDNPNTNCNALAHELWHISSGTVGHDVAHGTLAACQGNGVSPEYCAGLRQRVAPMGDFPLPVPSADGMAVA